MKINTISSCFIITIYLYLCFLSLCSAIKITKCCPKTQVIDIYRMKCRESGNKHWSPRFYYGTEEESYEDDSRENNLYLDINIETRIPRCKSGVHVFTMREIPRRSLEETKFRLLTSGRIEAQHINGKWVRIPDNSCIDGIMNYGNVDIPNSFTGEDIDQAIITCPVDADNIHNYIS